MVPQNEYSIWADELLNQPIYYFNSPQELSFRFNVNYVTLGLFPKIFGVDINHSKEHTEMPTKSYDVEEIKKQVASVLEYSQHLSCVKIDELIQKWEESKQYFIDQMHGQLIWESPEEVSFHLTTSSKRDEFEQFKTEVWQIFHSRGILEFFNCLSVDEFFNNMTENDHQVYYSNTRTDIKAGMKVLKALKLVESDINKVKEIQQRASMVIQRDCVSGILCFSVHPLDFLSVSENTFNWRSCHALDGEYRAGNLGYMTDNCTFICYLKSKKEAVLPNFPSNLLWNNKKWRNLLFMSNDREMMFAGRPYPFVSKDALDIVQDYLYKAGFGAFSRWHDYILKDVYDQRTETRFSIYPSVPVGNELMALNKLILDTEHSCHFNDLLNSSCYSPIYSYRNGFWMHGQVGNTSAKKTRFFIGDEVKCVYCGTKRVAASNGTMLCKSCANNLGFYDDDDSNDYTTCSCCGREIFVEDGYYLLYSNEYVCEQCYANETVPCEECEAKDYRDIIIYDDNVKKCLCPGCRRRHRRECEEEENSLFF